MVNSDEIHIILYNSVCFYLFRVLCKKCCLTSCMIIIKKCVSLSKKRPSNVVLNSVCNYIDCWKILVANVFGFTE